MTKQGYQIEMRLVEYENNPNFPTTFVGLSSGSLSANNLKDVALAQCRLHIAADVLLDKALQRLDAMESDEELAIPLDDHKLSVAQLETAVALMKAADSDSTKIEVWSRNDGPDAKLITFRIQNLKEKKE